MMRKAVVVSYDATVLAGTQGVFNHMKLDRMLALAEAQRMPLVLLAEGADLHLTSLHHLSTEMGDHPLERQHGATPGIEVRRGEGDAGVRTLTRIPKTTGRTIPTTDSSRKYDRCAHNKLHMHTE